MKNLNRSGATARHQNPITPPYPTTPASSQPIGLFAQIPPERVGINGEYDHAGLAKRVTLALQQEFGEDLVKRIAVSQRGRVVVIHTQALDPRGVRQLTRLALTIDGADYVEVFDTAQALQLVA